MFLIYVRSIEIEVRDTYVGKGHFELFKSTLDTLGFQLELPWDPKAMPTSQILPLPRKYLPVAATLSQATVHRRLP